MTGPPAETRPNEDYEDDDAAELCHHGVGFDERCAKCEAEMEFDE